jgi:cbb3-type cytochrome oxidase maturation protein
MIGASLFIALGFLGAFVWSVRKGHYDDDYTPSVRILMDDTLHSDSNRQFQEHSPDKETINKPIPEKKTFTQAAFDL